MLGRKSSSLKGQPLPSEWSDTVKSLLNQTYAKECDAQVRTFDVYGQIYSEELLIIIGFNPKEPVESATTCFLSCDASEFTSLEKLRITQAALIDVAGLFYDEIFATDEWSEWEPNWQEVEWKGKTYFYKLTRENVTLTLEANRLLKEAGFDPEEE